MKVEGTKQLGAPRERVWAILNDPARMAKLMPGVESFDVLDERRWRANVKIPLGLGGLRMSIDMEKTEEREPEFARLHAKGNGVGAFLDMDTSFRLSDAAGGTDTASTDMHWEADVRIAGTVASMGQRVIQPIVNQQVSNVLTALDREVQMSEGDELLDAGPPAEPTPEPAPADAGSSGAEEGIHEWHPEAYESEPKGPTTSTGE